MNVRVELPEVANGSTGLRRFLSSDSLVTCKALGVPAFNVRIGALTLLLVAGMLGGPARLWYALWRFVSTLFGALVVLRVAAICAGADS